MSVNTPLPQVLSLNNATLFSGDTLTMHQGRFVEPVSADDLKPGEMFLYTFVIGDYYSVHRYVFLEQSDENLTGREVPEFEPASVTATRYAAVETDSYGFPYPVHIMENALLPGHVYRYVGEPEIQQETLERYRQWKLEKYLGLYGVTPDEVGEE